MVGVSASVNLPWHHKVQKFSSGTGSTRVIPEKSRKTVVVWLWCPQVFNKKMEEKSFWRQKSGRAHPAQ